MKPIQNGKTTNVLWLGNGISRCFQGNSWETIIKDTLKRYQPEFNYTEIKVLPQNMQIVAASKDNVDITMQNLAKSMKEMYDADLSAFLHEFVFPLPFDNIITTNYTYELEQAAVLNYPLTPNHRYRCKTMLPTGDQRAVINRYEKSMITRYNQVPTKYGDKNIWHIHGEACSAASMVMGQYYYGKALRVIQDYLGNYMKVFQSSRKAGWALQPKSWLDFFMMGNVYVVGFGMDASEMDFWWLVCSKKRSFPETKIYVYEPNVVPGSSLDIMMQTYGLENLAKDKQLVLKEHNDSHGQDEINTMVDMHNAKVFKDFYIEVFKDLQNKLAEE